MAGPVHNSQSCFVAYRALPYSLAAPLELPEESTDNLLSLVQSRGNHYCPFIFLCDYPASCLVQYTFIVLASIYPNHSLGVTVTATGVLAFLLNLVLHY